MFIIHMSVTSRDKINKGPVRIYIYISYLYICIYYLVKYSAFKLREIIKSLRMKSGVEILYFANLLVTVCVFVWVCVCCVALRTNVVLNTTQHPHTHTHTTGPEYAAKHRSRTQLPQMNRFM
jgi:hypothetical protein